MDFLDLCCTLDRLQSFYISFTITFVTQGTTLISVSAVCDCVCLLLEIHCEGEHFFEPWHYMAMQCSQLCLRSGLSELEFWFCCSLASSCALFQCTLPHLLFYFYRVPFGV